MSQMQTQYQLIEGQAPAPDEYLARYADCMFWFARYMERAENLARLLDVIYTFTPGSRGEQNWQAVLAIHCDEEAFLDRYPALMGNNVLRFYMTDATHSKSIVSCLQQARMNASQLRATISTEMWAQINVAYNYVRRLKTTAIRSPELPTLLSKIRRHCQTHAGIAESGLYRNQAWYFYNLGRYVERADQITRLVDIKYHLLLPAQETVGSPVDISQWAVLLRAAGAYHTFHRESRGLTTPATVTEFLLMNAQFPRSVAFCVKTVHDALLQMRTQFAMERLQEAIHGAAILRQRLATDPINTVIATGLHEYLDELQLALIRVSDSIGRNCF